jgi:dolichyl-phosphate beta-glucosyltransferase
MAGADLQLSIIVPVRNGADRLPPTLHSLATYLSGAQRSTEVLLVDDGSDEPTARLLADFARTTTGVVLLRNEINQGKGRSVSRGMLAARGRHRVFTDADLAYPLDQVDAITAVLDEGSDLAIACRVLPESRYLMSPSFFHYLYTRHLMSRAYNALIRWTTLPGILDTQAGLKGFTARAAQVVFPRLTIPRFGFDVETLFIARRHGLRTTQVPVHFRYDSEPTTVRLMRDSWNMMADLARVRWNDVRGRYR